MSVGLPFRSRSDVERLSRAEELHEGGNESSTLFVNPKGRSCKVGAALASRRNPHSWSEPQIHKLSQAATALCWLTASQDLAFSEKPHFDRQFAEFLEQRLLQSLIPWRGRAEKELGRAKLARKLGVGAGGSGGALSGNFGVLFHCPSAERGEEEECGDQ